MAVDTVFGLDTLSRVYFTSVVDQDESCVLWRFESAIKGATIKGIPRPRSQLYVEREQGL